VSNLGCTVRWERTQKNKTSRGDPHEAASLARTKWSVAPKVQGVKALIARQIKRHVRVEPEAETHWLFDVLAQFLT
jgi:hypothetical protein